MKVDTAGVGGLMRVNVLLMEIDKGFRSSNTGEQLESVAKFPIILQQVPLPVLINSAFLKLGDLFRHSSSNAVRAYIASVTEQCGEYVPKIINRAEFLSKLESVLHSNDPVARSLALRALAAVAVIGHERVSCHDVIRTSLDSHDEVEVEAAILAAKHYAVFSAPFSERILPKVQSLLDCIGTSPEYTGHLISVLEFTGHTLESCARTVNVLLGYTSTYNTTPIFHHLLTVLTRASLRRRVLCSRVMGELLDYAALDERLEVQLVCLDCLLLFSRKVPHCWNSLHIQHLCKYFLANASVGNEKKVISSLKVLAFLPSSSCKKETIFSHVIDQCETMCYATSTPATINALTLYLHNTRTQDVLPVTELVISRALEHVNNHQLVPDALTVLDEITSKNCDWSTIRRITKFLFRTVADCLTSEREYSSALITVFLKKCVQYASKLKTNCNQVNSHIAKIPVENSDYLHAFHKLSFSKIRCEHLPLLCCVYFSCEVQDYSQAGDFLHEVVSRSSNDWMTYRIIRTLLRFGNYSLAMPYIKLLMEHSESEKVYVWLRVLQLVSEAEFCLPDRIGASISAYQSAARAIRSYKNDQSNHRFQKSLIQLRFEFLVVIKQLRDLVKFSKQVPLSKTALKISQDKKMSAYLCSELPQKFGRVWESMKCLCDAYHDLERSLLDADSQTLLIVGSNQKLVSLVTTCVHSLFLAHVPSSVRIPESHELHEETNECEIKIRSIVNLLKAEKCVFADVGIEHFEAMLRIVDLSLRQPCLLPRYFFQSVQTTSVKLMLSPSPKMAGEPLTVYAAGDNTTLTVEGLVKQKSNVGRLQRAVSKATISCNLRLTTPGNVLNYKLGLNSGCEITEGLTSTVTVDKGYFSAKLLLAPSFPGMYCGDVSLQLLDSTGTRWSCAATDTILLRAIEKPCK